jgi:hypothetical protein
MAGSWNRIVNDDGTPRHECFGVGHTRSLENDGDVIEVIEQLYGMIWDMAEDLAEEIAMGLPSRVEILGVIERAQENYKEGLERGKSGR